MHPGIEPRARRLRLGWLLAAASLVVSLSGLVLALSAGRAPAAAQPGVVVSLTGQCESGTQAVYTMAIDNQTSEDVFTIYELTFDSLGQGSGIADVTTVTANGDFSRTFDPTSTPHSTATVTLYDAGGAPIADSGPLNHPCTAGGGEVTVSLTGTCESGTQAVYTMAIDNQTSEDVFTIYELTFDSLGQGSGIADVTTVTGNGDFSRTFDPTSTPHSTATVTLYDAGGAPIADSGPLNHPCTNTGEVTAELTGACPSGSPVYTLDVSNTTSAEVTVRFKLNFDNRPAGDGIQENPLTIPAGDASEQFVFQPVNLATHDHETAKIDWVDSDVAGPVPTVENPCPDEAGVIEATLTGQCESNAPVYTLHVENGTADEVTVKFALNFDERPAGEGIQPDELTVEANSSGDHEFEPVDLATHSHQEARIDWVESDVEGPEAEDNPCAAPGQVEATLTGQCVSNAPVYALQVSNGTAAEITVEFALSFDSRAAGQGIQQSLLTVAVGGSQTHTFAAVDLAAHPHQQVKIDWVAGTVTGPANLNNPCPTTTTQNVAAVSGSGGGLAKTGVAIAVFGGIAALLFANGGGLLRLMRRNDGEDEDR